MKLAHRHDCTSYCTLHVLEWFKSAAKPVSDDSQLNLGEPRGIFSQRHFSLQTPSNLFGVFNASHPSSLKNMLKLHCNYVWNSMNRCLFIMNWQFVIAKKKLIFTYLAIIILIFCHIFLNCWWFIITTMECMNKVP